MVCGKFNSVERRTVWNEISLELINDDISRQCFKLGPKTWLFDITYS